MNELYAVMTGEAVLWRVVGWQGAAPLMVPLGRYVIIDGEPEYRPVPVDGGLAERPHDRQSVIFSPDLESLIPTIEPWMGAGDGE